MALSNLTRSLRPAEAWIRSASGVTGWEDHIYPSKELHATIEDKLSPLEHGNGQADANKSVQIKSVGAGTENGFIERFH